MHIELTKSHQTPLLPQIFFSSLVPTCFSASCLCLFFLPSPSKLSFSLRENHGWPPLGLHLPLTPSQLPQPPSFLPFPMRPHASTSSTKQSPPWSPCSLWGLSGLRWQVSDRLQVGVDVGQAVAHLPPVGMSLCSSQIGPLPGHMVRGQAALHRGDLCREAPHNPALPPGGGRRSLDPLQYPSLQVLRSWATTLPCTMHPGEGEAWSLRSPLPGPAPGTQPPGGSGWGPRTPSSQAPAGPRVWRPQDTCWGLSGSSCAPWPAVGSPHLGCRLPRVGWGPGPGSGLSSPASSARWWPLEELIGALQRISQCHLSSSPCPSPRHRQGGGSQPCCTQISPSGCHLTPTLPPLPQARGLIYPVNQDYYPYLLT